MTEPRCQRRPFTLLELLIASMAGAVLLAALLAALSGAWRLQEQAQERDRDEALRQAVRQRLALELALAEPPRELLAAGITASTEDVGGYRHDVLEWVAAVGARNPDCTRGDLVRVRYSLSEAENGSSWRLVRTEEQDLLAVETQEPEEVVLLENVISFSADWYDGQDWVTAWDSAAEGKLPQAARIRIEFAGKGSGPAPRPLELVVPITMRRVEEGT